MDCPRADFGTLEGATDGLDESVTKGISPTRTGHLRFFDDLSQGLKPLPQKMLDELSQATGMLVRHWLGQSFD